LEIATIIGAIVAIISFLFKPPHWTLKKDVAIKSAIAILVGLGSGLVVLIAGSIITDHGKTPPTHVSSSASNPSSASNSPTVRASNSPTASAKPEIASLVFQNLSDGQDVGHYETVTLSGTIPNGEHLWIFVYSSGLYYVQGRAQPQPPNFWSLIGVTFGSTATGDVNAPYTIYAVVADQQADGKISELLKRTKGNTGTSMIPGDGGAKKVRHVTVIRNH
jgi:hypothetical protein